MAATALVSARLEPATKERAEEVIRAANLSDTTVIRRVYEYIVTVGDVPEFVKTGEYDVELRKRPRDHFDDMATWMVRGPFSNEDFSWLSDDVVADALSSRFADE